MNRICTLLAILLALLLAAPASAPNHHYNLAE